MIRISFYPFLIIGLTGAVGLAATLIYQFKKVMNRNKQTLSDYKEEVSKLFAIIKKDKATLQELENTNEQMLEQINQTNIDQCKKHPLLKRLYDKTCVLSAFSDAEWEEFMLAFQSIYPHFTAKLQKQYPDMSIRDVHICIFSVMNLKTARIADLLNLQSDTLSSYKQKIKKDRFCTTKKKALDYFLLKYVLK